MGKKYRNIKYTFDEVKNFIESNSSCKLLSTEYIDAKHELELLCSCGDRFFSTFTNFNSTGKRECSECVRKRKSFTLDEVRTQIKSHGFEWVEEEYINSDMLLTIRDNFGYLYLTTLHRLRDFKPRAFHVSNIYTIHNIKLWCRLNNKNFELISTEYVGNKNAQKLKWKCLKLECGEIFESCWSSIYSNGSGCGYCAGQQVGISNCLATKYPEIAKQWHSTKNGELTPMMVTISSNKRVWWTCDKCNNEWRTSIHHRTIGERKCPQCRSSKGEQKITECLDKYKLYYQREYSFEDLFGEFNPLRFDFAIFTDEENMHLKCLIEFDHKQHFEQIKGWQTKEQFELGVFYDSLKNEYCRTHNIRLIRISYLEFDNIEEILIKELNLDASKTNDTKNSVIFNK
jgi:hypothetical protein